MYAVLKTGGKQYRVAKNDVITVERLAGDVGNLIRLDHVLMVGDDDDITIGAPLVEGAQVAATILDQKRGDKIIVFKKKRRKNYRRTRGHRQELTVLRITDILPDGDLDVVEDIESAVVETADAAMKAVDESVFPETVTSEPETEEQQV